MTKEKYGMRRYDSENNDGCGNVEHGHRIADARILHICFGDLSGNSVQSGARCMPLGKRNECEKRVQGRERNGVVCTLSNSFAATRA